MGYVILACVVSGLCFYFGLRGLIEAFLGTWTKHTLRRW